MLEVEDVSDNRAQVHNEAASSPQWSAAVGKASLGKPGRVIERLMGENDMLKRNLDIERLRADESNQAAKMAEAKMEALMSEYTALLHDATVNKTLLKKRDTQLVDLKAQVESEKQRAISAIEQGREWRDEVEKRELDLEARLYGALMEGRNNVMTSHDAEANRAVAELRKEIVSITKERCNDDEKISMLKLLSDQQAEQLRQLELEKGRIDVAFVAYKEQHNDMLRDIKAQEKKNEDILKESEQVLAELQWALGVKTKVRRRSE